MLKKVLILAILLIVSAYMLCAVTIFNCNPTDVECKGIQLVVKDSVNHGFITSREIYQYLNKRNISVKGKHLSQINTREIEECIASYPLVDNVECFISPSGKVGIEIIPRIPLLRVMNTLGDNFYVDCKGYFMPVSSEAAYVPVVTGNADRSFVASELVELGIYIAGNSFWRAQIEQINITSRHEIELVPRVGDHVLFLGKPGGYNEKFDRLKLFYTQGLNKVGWNKYSRISVEFSNQIICTKK